MIREGKNKADEEVRSLGRLRKCFGRKFKKKGRDTW